MLLVMDVHEIADGVAKAHLADPQAQATHDAPKPRQDGGAGQRGPRQAGIAAARSGRGRGRACRSAPAGAFRPDIVERYQAATGGRRSTA